MALRAAYGFESGTIPPLITLSAGTQTADPTIKRNGNYSLKGNNGSSATWTFPAITLPAASDGIIVGYGLYTPNTNGQNLLSVGGGISAFINTALNSDGTIQIYTATSSLGTTTLKGTTGSIIQQNTWHYLVHRYTFHDTTGIIELWVDGVQVLNLTAQDTIQSGSATTTRQFTFGKSSGNNSSYYDDMVFADSTGSGLNAVFAPVKIEALRPNSDVAENWTPSTGTDSFALVDEHPVSAADYISSNTPTTKDEWGMSDRTHIGGILALVAHGVGIDSGGGGVSLKVGLKRGGAESQSGGLVLASTTTHVQHVVENDPTTGVAWTDANANAVTMTVEVA